MLKKALKEGQSYPVTCPICGAPHPVAMCPFSRIQLTRPLAFLDLETTGVNAAEDRIVQIAIVVVRPDRTAGQSQTLVNPERPIPAEATEVHGITDAMVAGAPRFRQVAAHCERLLEGADIAGFNVRRFDVNMLAAEMQRAGRRFYLDGRRVVDAMNIFHAYEARDLSAAVRFYLGRDHAGAHDAMADALATWEVLEAQAERYQLEGSIEALAAVGVDPDAIDGDGKLVWKEFPEVGWLACLNFGEHKGKPLAWLWRDREGAGFLRWMLKKDFSDEVKLIVRRALEGSFPVRERRET